MNYFKIISNGIIKENPTFVLLLGMCPTLATTTSSINGMSMGLATMFVLVCSNIVVSLINIFVKSSNLQWVISFAGVAIFIGLTAWDTQKIKRMAEITDNENAGKLATIGALSLYLDFINLFLYLLRFFGSSRD